MKILALVTQLDNDCNITNINATVLEQLGHVRSNINKIYVIDEYSMSGTVENMTDELSKFLDKNSSNIEYVVTSLRYINHPLYNLIKNMEIIDFLSWSKGLEQTTDRLSHIPAINDYNLNNSAELGMAFFYRYGYSQLYLSKIKQLQTQASSLNINDFYIKMCFIIGGFLLGYTFA